MSAGAALSRLSEAKVRAWILARMREEQEDPPVDRSRLESPEDYVRVLHHEARDAKFRGRIEKAARGALREAAKGDLRAGPDARAVRHLAALVEGLDLRDAVPVLLEIAERGELGGKTAGLDPDSEEMVLFALAGLQQERSLWTKWHALWRREMPRLWPVVTAGLRLSDPTRALSILPEAVERAARHKAFPIGEVLWAFATDERYETDQFAKALEALPPEARRRCREALSALGAERNELDVWVPNEQAGTARDVRTAPPPAADFPAWARRGPALTRPPRFMEAAGWR